MQDLYHPFWTKVASKDGLVEVAELLLAAGADVETWRSCLYCRDNNYQYHFGGFLFVTPEPRSFFLEARILRFVVC